jgi:UDP-2,3-diacylglucosamine hydrolase
MTMAGQVFISDLHLSLEEPDTAQRFFKLLDSIQGTAEAVSILGDLFETWVGDDELAAPFQASIAHALARLTDSGIQVGIMHGNRDFLIGSDFLAASGAYLLPDPSLIDLYGEPTLLLHGDSLCSDDQDYQTFRKQVRSPAWQREFLAKPLPERLAIAREMRTESRLAQSGKSMAILDVNPEAVCQAFRSHGCRRMIHGHTHRPARHVLEIDGVSCERWVLTDWYSDGGYLLCDPSGCELKSLPR